jgi:hypothetical protein
MNRLGVAALALLLAAHGCAADDQTTTMEERRLMETTISETPDDVSGAVARSGSLGTVLLALLAVLFVGNAAAAAVDESTTMADERRLMDSTMAPDTPDDVSGAVARSGSLGTLLLAFLAFLFVGNAAGAAVDESTTMADERRLMDTTMAPDTPDDVSAAPRAAIWTTPVFALAAALGLAARR